MGFSSCISRRDLHRWHKITWDSILRTSEKNLYREFFIFVRGIFIFRGMFLIQHFFLSTYHNFPLLSYNSEVILRGPHNFFYSSIASWHNQVILHFFFHHHIHVIYNCITEQLIIKNTFLCIHFEKIIKYTDKAF